MLKYTKIETHMEIRAIGDNMLHGAAQGVLLLVVRGIYDALSGQIVNSLSAWFEEEYIFQFGRSPEKR